MPGRPPSVEPAIEDAEITNAKARIKLAVRIRLSPRSWALTARRCWRVDNHASFPQFCKPSEKWFRQQENCFVDALATKQFEISHNGFNNLEKWATGPDRLVQWPSRDCAAAMAVCFTMPGLLKTRNFRVGCALLSTSIRDGGRG
jgi:hypothetical protein